MSRPELPAHVILRIAEILMGLLSIALGVVGLGMVVERVLTGGFFLAP